MRVGLSLVVTMLVGCAAHGSVVHDQPDDRSKSVYRVDQLTYLRNLADRRPDLLKDPQIGYQAMMLRPAYRAELLSTSETPASLVAAHYTQSMRDLDAAWVGSQQAAEQALAADIQRALDNAGVPDRPAVLARFPVKAAAYNIKDYVGYFPNAGGKIWDSHNLVWLVYFCFHDAQTGFTPDHFRGYMQALAAAGFHGDAKIPVLPGQVRFQYNNLIVHAHSEVDARLAEKIGLDYFGASLSCTGRGLDVGDPNRTNGENGVVWSTYLLNGGTLDQLPAAAAAYVQYH
jgi:hypothetical protein